MTEVLEQTRSASPRDSAGGVRGLGTQVGELTALTRRLVAFNLLYAASAWLIAAAAIALFWRYPHWYTFIAAFLIVSSRQQALLNCEHEAVHRKFLPARRWNDLVGRYLCAAPVGSPLGAARDRHLAHHRLLGTPEDPDANLHSGEDKRTGLGLAGYFVRALLGGYAGMVLMGPRAPADARGTRNARRDLVSLVVVQAAIAGVITLTTAWWVYPALWLAPLASVTAFCHVLRSFIEHAITDDEASSPHGNRLITIHSNLIERGLVSPYYMNYHAEHHIVPSVPAPRLRELQNWLADHPGGPPVLARSSYGGALLRYARALRD